MRLDLHLLLAAAWVALPGPALAHDADRALSSFERAEARSARGSAVERIEWERRLRSPGAMPPPPPWRALDEALHDAVRRGDDARVRTLLGQGANPDALHPEGFSALGMAAFGGRRGLVRTLLRAGADATRASSSGQGALHLAAVAGHLGVIDELLAAQVPIDGLNRQRESALDVAASAGQLEAMSHLLAAGADASRAGQR